MFESLEEEIEVKADEYALEESSACNYGESTKHVYQGYFNGFKEGAKFIYNKMNEWHDLRKNPDDLPKLDDRDMSDYVITDMGVGYYNGRVKSWFILNECSLTDCVIAWCEKPKFEEVSK